MLSTETSKLKSTFGTFSDMCSKGLRYGGNTALKARTELCNLLSNSRASESVLLRKTVLVLQIWFHPVQLDCLMDTS